MNQWSNRKNKNSESFILLFLSIKTDMSKQTPITVFSDGGTTLSLMTSTAIETFGLTGKEMQMLIAKVSGKHESKICKTYMLLLIDSDGKTVVFKVYGIA